VFWIKNRLKNEFLGKNTFSSDIPATIVVGIRAKSDNVSSDLIFLKKLLSIPSAIKE